MLCSVTEWISAKAVVVSSVHQGVLRDAFAEVSHFRSERYACMTARGDTLFELCTAGSTRAGSTSLGCVGRCSRCRRRGR